MACRAAWRRLSGGGEGALRLVLSGRSSTKWFQAVLCCVVFVLCWAVFVLCWVVFVLCPHHRCRSGVGDPRLTQDPLGCCAACGAGRPRFGRPRFNDMFV